MARTDFNSRETIEFAAQGGQPDALFELGLIYSTGRDGTVDMIEAHKWFNLAAAAGHAEASLCRADISEEMTGREIAEAQRRARQWLVTAARQAA